MAMEWPDPGPLLYILILLRIIGPTVRHRFLYPSFPLSVIGRRPLAENSEEQKPLNLINAHRVVRPLYSPSELLEENSEEHLCFLLAYRTLEENFEEQKTPNLISISGHDPIMAYHIGTIYGGEAVNKHIKNYLYSHLAQITKKTSTKFS